MKRKRVIILGSTGSIGQSAMAVIRKQPGKFELVGTSSHTKEEQLLEQKAEFGVKDLALSGRKPISPEVNYSGSEGLLEMIRNTEADIVLNGVAGADGLLPSVAALESGKDLALANKESIVMAGELIKEIAREHGRQIIPVDSEHSAIFNLLRNTQRQYVAEVILTASGGAFRDTPIEELPYVTVKQALVHPTWSMGMKITIDSATMANKGLEVIETHVLFDMDVKKIKVLLHPQSYVHSLIRTKEGSLYAQISRPDMRMPIQNALSYPDIYNSYIDPFDLIGKKLEFYELDMKRYRMLDLAFQVLNAECPSLSIAYNAANEVAVVNFIKGKIDYLTIPQIVEKALQREWSCVPKDIEGVMQNHQEAVDFTKKIVG